MPTLPTLNCRNVVLFAAAALWLAGCSRTGLDDPTATGAAGGPAETGNELVQGRGYGKDNWWDALPRRAWSKFNKIEQSQPWFEVYEVREGVFAIYEDSQFEEVISYLILGTQRALLFDTGIGVGDMARVVAELTALPVTVLNSHTHYDHVGGNHEFTDVVAVDTPYTRNHAAGRDNNEVREFIGPGWVWKPLPAGVDEDSYASAAFEIQRYVDEGERFDLGGRVLELIRVPGHTPDALVLFDAQNRLMFMGDTFYPATLYAHMGDANFTHYAASAAKLAGYAERVDALLPAHNEPLVDGKFLTAMHKAFRAVQKPHTPYRLSDGDREYQFDGFSIMVSEPPPW